MRLLFEIDTKDYDLNGVAFIRHSARCINIKNGLVAMVHSIKYDYYKFPGGGIEEGESKENAMMREAREEAGLVVIPGSVKEYGYVHRIQKATMTTRTILYRTIITMFATWKRAYKLRPWMSMRRMNSLHWNMWNRTRPSL